MKSPNAEHNKDLGATPTARYVDTDNTDRTGQEFKSFPAVSDYCVKDETKKPLFPKDKNDEINTFTPIIEDKENKNLLQDPKLKMLIDENAKLMHEY